MRHKIAAVCCMLYICFTLIPTANTFSCSANYTFPSCPRPSDQPEQRTCCTLKGVQKCCYLTEVFETWQVALIGVGMAMAILFLLVFLCFFCGWAGTLDECVKLCYSFVCCRNSDDDEDDDEEELYDMDDVSGMGSIPRALVGPLANVALADLESLRNFAKENSYGRTNSVRTVSETESTVEVSVTDNTCNGRTPAAEV